MAVLEHLTSQQAIDLENKYGAHNYHPLPVVLSKGEGVYVWDLEGNKYIDMSIGGIGANVLGYADEDVDSAVKEAISKGTSSSLNCYEDILLAELLSEIHPWSQMSKFTRSGGEAMAVAVRIARAYTGKEIIAFCGYHGWNDWYLAANIESKDNLSQHLLSGLDAKGIPKGLRGTAIPFRYNQLEEIQNIVDKFPNKIAAIVMEPIRSAEPVPGFIESVRKLATDSSAMLIFDEISSGFRLNSAGAHIKFGVDPDMAVFSKALGNGYPIAAIIGTSEVMESSQSTFISSTNWTERIGPTAALATITKHKDNDVSNHLVNVGKKIQNGWKDISENNDLDIRVSGIPPLSHFIFNTDNPMAYKTLFVELMLKEGFLASTSFYSMYAHTNQHVDMYLDAVQKVFKLIKQYEQSEEIMERISGRPASQGFSRLA